MQLLEISDREAWDEYVAAHENGHPLQLWGWGEGKRENGWTAHRLVLQNGESWAGGAQVLTWRIPRTRSVVAYVPRGPVVVPGSEAAYQLMRELVKWARGQHALYLRIEPAWTAYAPGSGWVRAKHYIQLRETYVLDLRRSEDELLEAMSRKHRQYIRKAERDGITVERVAQSELGGMFELYTETAKRAGFGIHSRDYYETLQKELGEQSYLYQATFEGRPVAFLWLSAAGRTAYELYGGVSAEGGELKANYYLKWRAIHDMKAAGYDIYDFNGRLNDGVSRFKDGFGPAAVDYIGTYDHPMNAVAYNLWEKLWPVAKPIGRRILGVARRSGK